MREGERGAAGGGSVCAGAPVPERVRAAGAGACASGAGRERGSEGACAS